MALGVAVAAADGTSTIAALLVADAQWQHRKRHDAAGGAAGGGEHAAGALAAEDAARSFAVARERAEAGGLTRLLARERRAPALPSPWEAKAARLRDELADWQDYRQR